MICRMPWISLESLKLYWKIAKKIERMTHSGAWPSTMPWKWPTGIIFFVFFCDRAHPGALGNSFIFSLKAILTMYWPFDVACFHFFHFFKFTSEGPLNFGSSWTCYKTTHNMQISMGFFLAFSLSIVLWDITVENITFFIGFS